jgi:hypothetical protein
MRHAHKSKRIGTMRSPVVVRTKPDVARLVTVRRMLQISDIPSIQSDDADIKRVLLELDALHEVTGEAKPWRLRWSQDRRSVAT